MPRRPHQSLDAWRQAMRLAKAIYLITRTFPREELYGLTSQVRRAAVSIPSNLAEGAARTSRKEFAQFISISIGSLSELETQMLIASELRYLSSQHEVFDQLERVAQLLSGLHRNIIG
jgi:four helix bundle protein